MKGQPKKIIQRRVPKLRFPEFRDAPEWEEIILGEVITLEYGSPLPESNRTGGPFPVVGSNGVVGYHNTQLVKGPAIVVGRKGSAGQINWIDSDCYPIDTTFFVKKKGTEDYLLNFLKVLLERNNLEKLKDNGAVPGLNRNDVHSIRSFFPECLEQKKIADCLSSIDELIAAQTQKLDTLKAHKKGLMQQLFPAEGEAVPKLRFPEFRDAPVWEKSLLGTKALKIGSGVTPNGGDKNYKSKGRPFIRSQNIGWGCLNLNDVAFIDEATHSTFSATEIKANDVFLNITGASIGRSAVADDRVHGGNVNQHVCIIRTKQSELNPIFLNQYLLSQNGQRQIDSFQAGGNRQGLNYEQVRSFSLPLPLIEEQRKIADCLSSTDELIAVQTRKLETLKAHKKGLMQQLFPPADEGMA